MNHDTDKTALMAEFPELSLDDVLFEKEIYAHFGLLYFKFALVEHSLINISTFSHVGSEFHSGKIKTKNQWEASFDAGYEVACDQTFGNLINRIIKEPEFTILEPRLKELKHIRDYFTHRFFREEILHFSDENSCWRLLIELAKLRHSTIAVEQLLKPPFATMCKRYGISTPNEQQLDEYLEDMKENHLQSLEKSGPKYGWKPK
ncbi:MAG: hypothetical protein GY755_19495 [Chloroflexi bacterium]|nr:hypothetical protein [Chloroflexota bacterium]